MGAFYLKNSIPDILFTISPFLVYFLFKKNLSINWYFKRNSLSLLSTKKTTMEYNHKLLLEDFDKGISIIKNAGFNPIAVTQMYCEETFVFETTDEANRAYHALDATKPAKISAYWYGREAFSEAKKEYEQDAQNNLLVYWL